MPPKKGGKGGVVIDGVDTTSMTREQLEVFALRVKEENEREREERNFFQMERDKLRTFWEITRNELEEARAKLRNKDRQIEEEAEHNEEELRMYKQKVKHLQYEHQSDLTDNKAQSMATLKLAQDDHMAQEGELLRDKRELKKLVREQEVAHQDQIKSLSMHQSEQISEIKEEYQTKAKELEVKYEKKFSDLRFELNTKHRMEMTEIEERKNTQITNLTKNHETAFNDMKNYYNDITLNNLALISSLKDQMESLRKQNQRMTKQVADLTAENKKLVEPLRQAEITLADYKRRLLNYEKDKIALANTLLKYQATKKELSDLQWANEALEMRFDKLKAERDELHKRFVEAILEVQQKSGLKNVLLQKRIQKLNEVAEYRETIIGDLAAITEGQPVNKKLEMMLNKKNETIKDLKYELARVCKAHDDLLENYEEKLVKYGIPKGELGFTPMRVLPEGQAGLSRGPAGLVAKKMT